MGKSVMGVVKGVTWGVVAGMAAGYIGSKMMTQNKKVVKKKANKALRSVETILDTAQYLFK